MQESEKAKHEQPVNALYVFIAFLFCFLDQDVSKVKISSVSLGAMMEKSVICSLHKFHY